MVLDIYKVEIDQWMQKQNANLGNNFIDLFPKELHHLILQYCEYEVVANNTNFYGYKLYGQKEGKWIFFDVNGQIRRECIYKDNLKEGLSISYWKYEPYQVLKRRISYTKDIKHGTMTEWHWNSNKAKECEFINGEYEGKYLTWYEDSALHTECNYTNGKKDGVEYEWHGMDAPMQQTIFINDLRQGKFISWHDNGNVNVQGIYIDDKKQGQWTTNYKYGSIKNQGEFLNDKKYRKWTWRDPRGNIYSEVLYDENGNEL